MNAGFQFWLEIAIPPTSYLSFSYIFSMNLSSYASYSQIASVSESSITVPSAATACLSYTHILDHRNKLQDQSLLLKFECSQTQIQIPHHFYDIDSCIDLYSNITSNNTLLIHSPTKTCLTINNWIFATIVSFPEKIFNL